MSPSTSLRVRLRAALLVFVVAILLVPLLRFSALGGAERAAQPLPVLGRVADFSLVDQASSPVDRAALAGKPWVANFIFTRCSSTCPRLSDRMRAVRTLARGKNEAIQLVTFSVDPEHDQPSVLASYAEAYGADANDWKFLTGSESSVEAIARSFSVALEGKADPSKADFGIMHSGHLILVDGSARIRGYYPSSEEGVENQILRDLERLDAS